MDVFCLLSKLMYSLKQDSDLHKSVAEKSLLELDGHRKLKLTRKRP